MKPLGTALLAMAALAFLIGLADEVSATTTCQGGSGPSVANTCQGYAHVSTTTGGVASARCFAFRTTNSAPTCALGGLTPTNENWQIAAGACINVYYFDTTTGAVPPAAPNKVSLRLFGDATGTEVRAIQSNAAEPSNGQSFSVCATTTGSSGGAARAGTYRIRVDAIKDNSVGGTQDYNINSDGTATVGTIASYDRGALRSTTTISSITRSSYPAGSTFSYGTASDEQVTITASFIQPNTPDTSNAETAFTSILDNAGLSIGQAGTTTDIDSQTSLAQSFVVDQTFPSASSPYVGGYTIAGNAALTGLRWTVLDAAGHGSCVTRVSDTFAYCSTTFNIDPDVKWSTTNTASYAGANNLVLTKLGSSSGAVTTLFNRGETVYWEAYLINSRGELLTRAMTVAVHDSIPTLCQSLGSITPSSSKYSGTYVISTGTTCLAAFDTSGSLRTFTATNTDQSKKSGSSFFVSSFYYVDYHPQKTTTLVQDDWPTQNAAEQSTYVISSDVMHIWCHVRGVRLDVNIDTGVNDVIVKETETDDTTVIDTFTIGTGADGWTTTSDTVAPVPPSRTIHGHCDVAFNGNTGSAVQSIGWSSAFTGNLNCRIAAGNYWPEVGNTTRLYVEVTQDGAPAVPDETPEINIYYVNESTMPATWVPDTLATSLRNVDDDTTTVSGSLYYIDWTPVASGLVSLETHCQIQGSPLFQDKTLSVLPMTLDIDIAGTDFYGLGLDGFLFFLFWFGCLVAFLLMEWKFMMASSVLGIILVVFPDFGFKFAANVIILLFGAALQFMKDDQDDAQQPKPPQGT